MLKRLMLTTAATALLAGGAQAQQLGDVFVISRWRTTTSRSRASTSPQQLLNNPAAPYLNSLMTPGNPNAAQTSYASNYYNACAGASTRLSRTTSGRRPASPGPSTTRDPSSQQHRQRPQPQRFAPVRRHPLEVVSGRHRPDPERHVNPAGRQRLTSTVAPQDQWTVPLKSFSGTSAAYTNPYNGSPPVQFRGQTRRAPVLHGHQRRQAQRQLLNLNPQAKSTRRCSSSKRT